MMDINIVNVREHFTHSTSHIFSSDYIRASEKQFHLPREKEDEIYCSKKDEIYCSKFFAVRVSGEVWLALTLVNAWSVWAEILWRVRFLKSVLIGTKIEVKRLTKVGGALTLLLLPCVDFFWTALTFLGLNLSWLDDWFEDCCDTFWVGRPRRLCWLKHPTDLRNAPTHSLVSGLSSIDPLVCSISVFT